ncbi:hypothetical protein A6A29_08985 [Streptomyces sp. TSRI0281]|nr:hypothetical protein A6A29_08985 [Streptomyces sp. TSRI0281]
MSSSLVTPTTYRRWRRPGSTAYRWLRVISRWGPIRKRARVLDDLSEPPVLHLPGVTAQHGQSYIGAFTPACPRGFLDEEIL